MKKIEQTEEVTNLMKYKDEFELWKTDLSKVHPPEGETVYDPFSGIASTGYQAIKMGRKYYGCELSSDYFRDGLGYLQAAEDEVESPTLFDFLPEITNAS